MNTAFQCVLTLFRLGVKLLLFLVVLNMHAPAFAKESADIPLIELYPFPIWYQRDMAEGGSDDKLVVLDPETGRVSMFSQLQFLRYPKFHIDNLTGKRRLRLEGYDLSQSFFKRWYLDPQTGTVSQVKSPTGNAMPDHFRWCNGAKKPHWLAMGYKTEQGHTLQAFPNTNNVEEMERRAMVMPLPIMKQPWSYCEHTKWIIAHNGDHVVFYDSSTSKSYSFKLRGRLQHIILRQNNVFIWSHLPAASKTSPIVGKPYTLSRFNLQNQRWVANYSSQKLPFLPLKNLNKNALLLGPPWLPSDYKAPYFRLNTRSGQLSEAIQVNNQGPGKIENLQDVFKRLQSPVK